MDYSAIFSFILIIASFKGSELPEPTPEIQNLVVQLGDKKFKVREKAHQQLLDHKRAALKACLLGQKNPDFEIANRCKQIYDQYFTVSFTYGIKFPSIYLLDDKHRYPLGVEYERESDGSYYCKNFQTIVDVGVFYFEKARVIYNNNLTKENIKFGFKVESYVSRDGAVEELAMQLYLKDLLYYGKSKEEIIRILADTENKTNLYIYHPYTSPRPPGPGPAVIFHQN